MCDGQTKSLSRALCSGLDIGNGNGNRGNVSFGRGVDQNVTNNNSSLYDGVANPRRLFCNNPYTTSSVRTSRHDDSQPSYSCGPDGVAELLRADLIFFGFSPSDLNIILAIHKALLSNWDHSKGTGPFLGRLNDDNFPAPFLTPYPVTR